MEVGDQSFSCLSVLLAGSHREAFAEALFSDFKFKNSLITGLNAGDASAIRVASRLISLSSSIVQVREYCAVLIDTLQTTSSESHVCAVYVALNKYRKTCGFLINGKLGIIVNGVTEGKILFAVLLQRLMEIGDREAAAKGAEILNKNIEDPEMKQALRHGLLRALRYREIATLAEVKSFGTTVL